MQLATSQDMGHHAKGLPRERSLACTVTDPSSAATVDFDIVFDYTTHTPPIHTGQGLQPLSASAQAAVKLLKTWQTKWAGGMAKARGCALEALVLAVEPVRLVAISSRLVAP